MAKLIVLVGLIVTILVDYSTAQGPGFCVICDSNDLLNPNRLDCIHRPATLPATPCAYTADLCFMRILAGHTIRGCFGTLTTTEQTVCVLDPNNSCQSCTTFGVAIPCNTIPWPATRHSCHQCNHTVGDLSACETLQDQVSIGCPLHQATDQCYTLRNDTQVVRGCVSSEALCNVANNCNLCTGTGCNDINGGTIPEVGGERTRCITCQSSPGGNFACATRPDSETVSICSTLGEQCFSRIINNETHRGCLNELPTVGRDNCTLTPNNLCQTCQHNVGVNPCNNAIFPTNRLRCHDCFGMPDSHCANGRNSIEDACSRFVEEDQCFVQRFLNGNVRRGCLSNVAECAEPGRCFLCGNTACNDIIGTDTRVPTFNGVNKSFNIQGNIHLTKFVLDPSGENNTRQNEFLDVLS